MFSVFPLICYIARVQVFQFLYGADYPSKWLVLGLNLLFTVLSTLTSIFYPNVGDILRFTGAFCGLIYVFVLPIAIQFLVQFPAPTKVLAGRTYHTLMENSPLHSGAVSTEAYSYQGSEYNPPLPPSYSSYAPNSTLLGRATPSIQDGGEVPNRTISASGDKRQGWRFWGSLIFHGCLLLFGGWCIVGQFVTL